jgi:hypothetical protein
MLQCHDRSKRAGPEVGAMIHDPLVTWGSYEIQTAIGWP